MSSLPKVLNPKRVDYVQKNLGDKLQVFRTDLKNKRVEQQISVHEDVNEASLNMPWTLITS